MRFDQYVRAYIFGPLGMTQSSFNVADLIMVCSAAGPHLLDLIAGGYGLTPPLRFRPTPLVTPCPFPLPQCPKTAAERAQAEPVGAKLAVVYNYFHPTSKVRAPLILAFVPRGVRPSPPSPCLSPPPSARELL